MTGAREKIFEALNSVSRNRPAERPQIPPLNEVMLEGQALIDKFASELAQQTGVVHFAENPADILKALSEICAAEGATSVVISSDDILTPLDVEAWAALAGIRVYKADDKTDREAFKQDAFRADAGVTGAAFAVAESGTIGVIIGADMPRLASIAPPVHIAIVPADRLFPTYEAAIMEVLPGTSSMPSQLVLITGPSATADISALPFKGMHGPAKLHVIIAGHK